MAFDVIDPFPIFKNMVEEDSKLKNLTSELNEQRQDILNLTESTIVVIEELIIGLDEQRHEIARLNAEFAQVCERMSLLRGVSFVIFSVYFYFQRIWPAKMSSAEI